MGESAPLLPGVMQLTRLHNTGAAWSSFSGQTGLLAAVTVVLLAAVACCSSKRSCGTGWASAPAMLMLGGGIGNMIDRIVRGYVVDMFDLELFMTTRCSIWRTAAWWWAPFWAGCTTCGPLRQIRQAKKKEPDHDTAV